MKKLIFTSLILGSIFLNSCITPAIISSQTNSCREDIHSGLIHILKKQKVANPEKCITDQHIDYLLKNTNKDNVLLLKCSGWQYYIGVSSKSKLILLKKVKPGVFSLDPSKIEGDKVKANNITGLSSYKLKKCDCK